MFAMKKSTLFSLPFWSTLVIAMGLIAGTAWATLASRGVLALGDDGASPLRAIAAPAPTVEGITWAEPMVAEYGEHVRINLQDDARSRVMAQQVAAQQTAAQGGDYLPFGSTYVGTDYASNNYLPLRTCSPVARNYGGWSTVICVAAIDNYMYMNPVDITITFYDLIGTVVHTITDTIPHLGSHIYAQKTMSGLPENFAGSAHVQVINWLDHAVATTVKVVNGDLGGDGLMSYSSSTSPFPENHIPLVRRTCSHGNAAIADPMPMMMNSTLFIMNTDDVSMIAVINVYDQFGSVQRTINNVLVPARTTYIYDLASDAQLPDGFIGSVEILSDHYLHVVIMDMDTTGERGAAYMHRPIFSATDWYLPMICQEYYGWNSKFWILGLDLTARSADITYYGTSTISETTGTLNWHRLGGPYPTVMSDGQANPAYGKQVCMKPMAIRWE